MDERRPLRQPTSDTDSINPGVTRRQFLKVGGMFIAASIPVLSSCQPTQQGLVGTPIPTELQYPFAPPAPDAVPEVGDLRFFTPDEYRTVEALTSRLLPGTPDDPGAREARVTNYIDFQMSFDDGYHEAVYRDGPYAETYEGDTPPESDSDLIWIPADQIERYGYQSRLTPAEVYRVGVAAVNRYAQETYGSAVADLSEDQQDRVIQDLLDGNADDYFTGFSGEAFFHVLRRHTDEGMFSDPAYGGNWDMVGWRLIGYPGAQRAYTPDEIREEDPTPRPPQSLHQMHHFNPGEPAGPRVVLPVSGSDEEYSPDDTYGTEHDH